VSLGAVLTVIAGLAGLASARAPRLTLGTVCIGAVTATLLALATAKIGADRSFLFKVFLLAVLVRTTLAVTTYHLLPYGFFAPDELGYRGMGSDLAASGLPDPASVVRGAAGWYYLNAVLAYFFAQDAQLLARLWNCGVGAVVPILCYRLTNSLGGPAAGRVTAVLTAFCPSLVLWSSLNLKDTDTQVLLLGIMLLSLSLSLQRSWKPGYLLLMGPMLVLLASLRQYLLIPLLTSILVAQMVVRRGVLANLSVVVIVGGLLVVPLTLSLPDLAEWSPRLTNVENVNAFRTGFASGAGSVFLSDTSFTSPLQLVAFLPSGLLFFFLGPFPWNSGSLLQQLATPEMLLYYVSLPFMAIGLRRAIRRHPSQVIPLLTFSAIVAISYSLTLTNFGTLFRFRDQLLLIMLCFAGVGLRGHDRRERPAPAEPRTAQLLARAGSSSLK
jgi:hypothetical protein